MLTIPELIERHRSETGHKPEDQLCGFCQLAIGIARRQRQVEVEREKTSDLFAELCSFNLRLTAAAKDMKDYLDQEAIQFAGKELDGTSNEKS